MQKRLIIVESPSKAKSIQSYLGDNYEVVSSKGHVRDLSTKGEGGLGVDVKNGFKPDYILISKQLQLVRDIKKQAKNKEVLIATDPDREGEAIAWHLAYILDLDLNDNNRVIFKEITKNNVLKEIENKRPIDMKLVRSQETRRILDRIIGFKLSNIVKFKFNARSAGRVQSIALKLICELEKEIQKFIPEKYFDLKLIGSNFEANYVKKTKELVKEEEKNQVLEEAKPLYNVKSINVRDSISKPKLPFITSTLQQEAFNKLSMSTSSTMMNAQSLYEGVEIEGELTGLITYMRTDSTRLSNDFVKGCRNYIREIYGEEYVGAEYVSKNKDLTQDAHEAIRPTDLSLTPERVEKYLTPYEFKLYKLIYNRTLTSLMSNAVNEVTTVIFEKNNHEFKLEGIKNKFLGYLIVEGLDKEKQIPKFNVGDKIDGHIEWTEKETLPPARYNEASLIKALEQRGIGRPSTYATIIKTLKVRDYVVTEKKYFIPTELGMAIVDRLSEFFPTIMTYEYTSNMEKELDDIAYDKVDNVYLLDDFYKRFIPAVENAINNMPKQEPKILEELCPECQNKLVVRRSRYGEFIACSGFPKCKYIKK